MEAKNRFSGFRMTVDERMNNIFRPSSRHRVKSVPPSTLLLRQALDDLRQRSEHGRALTRARDDVVERVRKGILLKAAVCVVI